MQIKLSAQAQAHHHQLVTLQQTNKDLKEKVRTFEKWFKQNDDRLANKQQKVRQLEIKLRNISAENEQKEKEEQLMQKQLQEMKGKIEVDGRRLQEMIEGKKRMMEERGRVEERKGEVKEKQNGLEKKMRQKEGILEKTDIKIRECDQEFKANQIKIDDLQRKIRKLELTIKEYQQ